MKKRIFSAVLCLCMIMALLPTTALAADTVGKVIITMAEPVAGQPLATTASTSAGANSQVTKVLWEGELDSQGNAQAGESYLVNITVEIKPGTGKVFEINYDKNIILNDQQATYKLVSETKLVVAKRYTLPAANLVNTVAVTIDEPTVGKPLATTASVPATANTTVLKVVWDGVLSPDGGPLAGETYTVRIKVGIKEGTDKKFDTKGKDWHLTVNGNKAQISYPNPVAKELTMEYTWTLPEAPAAPKDSNAGTGYWAGAPAVLKDSPFTFAGGSGTRADPYLVATADQLNAIRKGLDKHYKLTADIDLSTWGNWVPIGGTPAYGGPHGASQQKGDKDAAPFTGSLDGAGHVISGMTIVDHRTDLFMPTDMAMRSYGLFANIQGSTLNSPSQVYGNSELTMVKNLGVVNYTIDLSYANMKHKSFLYIGPIAGNAACMGIDNCYSSGGSIKLYTAGANTQANIGGIAGSTNSAAIQNCYNTSPITASSSAAQITSNIVAAGIVANVEYTWVQNCFNTGNITVPYGRSWTNSVACGILGASYIADIPGIYHEPVSVSTYVKNCYNTGAMTANAASGVVGYSASDMYVDNCYNVGKLTTNTAGAPDWNFTSDIVCKLSAVLDYGTEFVKNNGVNAVSGDAWQSSSKLGRKVLKVHPEDALSTPAAPTTPTAPAEPTVGGFTDVKQSAYYADAVVWAVDQKITAGTSATTFSPSKTCSRAEILTFLWRAVGSPAATAANPFTDVKSSDYYYGAALWAAEKGMVTGSTFGGSTPCTRASTVTYLWQNSGSPSTDAVTSFTDVPSGAPYAQAVAWAVEKGVTSGTSANTFSPDSTCDRGQIVTFLMRALK